MSVPPNRISNYFPAPQFPVAPGPQGAQGLVGNLVNGEGPNAAQDPANGRGAQPAYASVHNLQHDARFAKLFQRVDVTEQNVRDFFDNRLAQANARLAPAVQAQVPEAAAQAAPGLIGEDAPPAELRFAQNYADNFDFSANDAGKLAAKLKPNEADEGESFADKAYSNLRQDLRMAVEVGDAGKSGISRFLNKFKNLFNGSEKVRYEKTAVADAQGNQALEMKLHTSSSRAQGEGHKLDTSYKKDLKDKTFWSKVGWGLAAATLATVAVAVLGPAAIIGGIASLGLTGLVAGAVAAPVLMKAATYIKAPWWGKTVEGQIQHRERAQADELAESYAKQVRSQLIGDQTNRDGEVPQLDGEPSLPKRLLIDNPRKASDFLKLAHENDRDALFEQVRKELLNKETSHLDPQTIKNATKGVGGFFKDWGLTGNQKGHANKTIDIVAEKITQGIMRGVAEGMMDLAIARCSDEMTEAARQPLWETVKPRLDAFNEAINRFRPGNNVQGLDSQYGIHETGQPLDRLQRYQAQAAQLTATLKKTLEDKASDWGANNVKAFSEGLDQLNEDIQTHVVSLQEIKALVEGRGDDEAPNAVSIASVNEGLAGLMAGPFASVEDIEQNAQVVKGQIDALRAQVTGQSKPKLVQEHGEAFLGLLEKMDQARTALVSRAKTQTEVNQTFDSGNMDRVGLGAQLERLQALENDRSVDINPTNAPTVSDAMGATRDAVIALRKQGEALRDAYHFQDEFATLQNQSIVAAKAGDFESAVNQVKIRQLESKIDLQRDRIETWTRSRPRDLPQLSLGDWKAQVVAARLGVEESAAELKPILEKLCQSDNGPMLAQLAALPPETKQQALRVLAQAAQGNNNAAALKAFRALGKTLPEGTELDLRKLVSSVLPSSLEALNRMQGIERSAQLLSALQASELGQKLREAVDDQPNDVLQQLRQALVLANADVKSQSCLTAIGAARGDGTLDELLDDPERMAGLQLVQADIEQLNLLLTQLLAPNLPLQGTSKEQRLLAQQAAEQLATALKPRAMARVLAQEIGGAGAEGAGAPQVKAAVEQAVQLLDPAKAQEALDVDRDIQQAQKLERQVENESANNLENLSRNAQQLLGLLGLEKKMTAEQLVDKIGQNRELANELNLLFGSLTALEGQQIPAGLRSEYSSQERLDGAKELGSLTPWSKQQIEATKQSNNTLAERLKQRNALITLLKGNNESQLQRLLQQSSTARKVDDYLNENRALKALQQAGNHVGTTANFRTLIGQSAAEAMGQVPNLKLQRDTYLNEANARSVQQELIQGLHPRLMAVQELIDESDRSFITSQSNYLVSQIPAHYEQITDSQEILNAFKTAASPELAALGAKLREADTLARMIPGHAEAEKPNLTMIKTHFLKGQLDASVEALKYLQLDKFEAKRPGFFGRFMYKLMGRGESLNRLKQSDTRKQIGELIGLSSQQQMLTSALQQQLNGIQATIKKAQARQELLFSDLGKAKLAFTLLAVERLGAKSPEGTATLTEEDIEVVAQQWRDLAGEDNAEKLRSVLNELRTAFSGKSAADIEQGLNETQFNEVAKQLGQLMADRREIEDTHRQFRTQILDGKIKTLDLNAKDAAQKKLAIEAGLESADFSSVDTLTKSDVLGPGHLDRWAKAASLASREPGQALALATYGKWRMDGHIKTKESKLKAAKQELETCMTAYTNKSSPQTKAAMDKQTKKVQDIDQQVEMARAVLSKLEDSFLRQLGELAPASLPDPTKVPEDLAPVYEAVRRLENDLTNNKSINHQEISQTWRQLSELQPKYSPRLLNGEKAPASLAAIALGVDLNFRLGQVALKAIGNINAEGGLDQTQREQRAKDLNDLGTQILKAAEEGTEVMEEGSGKWNCPPGLQERYVALGGRQFEGKIEALNKSLGSNFKDRFHQDVANQEEEDFFDQALDEIST
jgi:hypothetical protein